MIPRGEVALIIAGIGLAGGILNQDAFNAAIIIKEQNKQERDSQLYFLSIFILLKIIFLPDPSFSQ